MKTAIGMASLALVVVLLGCLYGLNIVSREIELQISAQSAPNARLPQATNEILARNGEKIGEFTSYKRIYVPYNRIPPIVIHAFVSAEDKDFFTHNGISALSMARAYVVNLLNGKILQGASTITQQLVRLMFLTNERNYTRKIKEVVLSLALETKVSKEQIMELYLNAIYLGAQSYGVQAAATTYFHKSIADITPGEAAMLAGLTKAPSYLAPDRHYRRAKTRQRAVLRNMLKNGYLDQKEFDRWTAADIMVHKTSSMIDRSASYFRSRLGMELEKHFDGISPIGNGYRITSTLDLQLQSAAQKSLEPYLEATNRRTPHREVTGALVTLRASTGEVVAMIGGNDYAPSSFNRVTQIQRPIGGLVLPIVYSLAVERGYHLFEPLVYDGGKPIPSVSNKTLFECFVSLDVRESLDLFAALGATDVQIHAQNLGLKWAAASATLALGEGQASPLQVAVAMAALLNGGIRHSPRYLNAISDTQGYSKYIATEHPRSIVRPTTSFIMRFLLAHTEAMDAQSDRPDRTMLTSASPDRRNGWFLGSENGLVTVIWIGTERGIDLLAPNQQAIQNSLARLGETYLNRLPATYAAPLSTPPEISYQAIESPRWVGADTHMVPFVPTISISD